MERDLARQDLWEQSLARSRARREAAAARAGVQLPARKVSATALAVLAGGPVVGVAAAQVIGGDEDRAAGSGVAARPAAVKTVESAGAEAAAGMGAVAERESAAADHPGDAGAKRAASSANEGEAGPAAAARAVEKSAPAQEPPPAPATRMVATRERPAAGAARAGGGVEELQRALGIPVDGDFGARTERALERWQRAHGLTADGIAGPATRARLGLGKGRVLKREKRFTKRSRGGGQRARKPARGGGVKALQRKLGLPADGVFGPATQRALKRWQRAHGLVADGVAGPQTRRKLGLGPGPVLKRKGGGGKRRSSPTGGGGDVVQRVIAAANAIATKPYRYGGGHGSFNDSGYDCSGSISYALHGGGLLSSPLDSSGFMSWGEPGRGRRITVYANPGHAFMVIDGRRFDTSARSQTGSRWSSTMRSTAGYVARHPRGL